MESKVEKSSPALRFWNWLQAMFFIEWIRRHVYIYNVTFGLYMLELWEQVLFSILPLLSCCLGSAGSVAFDSPALYSLMAALSNLMTGRALRNLDPLKMWLCCSSCRL